MFSNDIVCNILEYIDININTKISINSITKKLNYNRYYLMKLFKKEIKISIIDYINAVRIFNSLKNIKKGDSFTSTAINNGFYSLEYFSETFKNILGINPRTYKKIINYHRNIKDQDMIIYLNKLSDLNLLIDYCNKYKTNRKPTTPKQKILSIFKNK